MTDEVDNALTMALLNPVATAGEVRLSLSVSGLAILSTASTAEIVEGLLQIITVAMPPELQAQDPRVIKAGQLVAQLRGQIQ
jgi:hypothetical protein